MSFEPKKVSSVVVDYSVPDPARIIRATDAADNTIQYASAPTADAVLIKQVCNKIIANVDGGASIILTINMPSLIVKDEPPATSDAALNVRETALANRIADFHDRVADHLSKRELALKNREDAVAGREQAVTKQEAALAKKPGTPTKKPTGRKKRG